MNVKTIYATALRGVLTVLVLTNAYVPLVKLETHILWDVRIQTSVRLTGIVDLNLLVSGMRMDTENVKIHVTELNVDLIPTARFKIINHSVDAMTSMWATPARSLAAQKLNARKVVTAVPTRTARSTITGVLMYVRLLIVDGEHVRQPTTRQNVAVNLVSSSLTTNVWTLMNVRMPHVSQLQFV
jgi:hypothetical protein